MDANILFILYSLILCCLNCFLETFSILVTMMKSVSLLLVTLMLASSVQGQWTSSFGALQATSPEAPEKTDETPETPTEDPDIEAAQATYEARINMTDELQLSNVVGAVHNENITLIDLDRPVAQLIKIWIQRGDAKGMNRLIDRLVQTGRIGRVAVSEDRLQFNATSDLPLFSMVARVMPGNRLAGIIDEPMVDEDGNLVDSKTAPLLMYSLSQDE